MSGARGICGPRTTSDFTRCCTGLRGSWRRLPAALAPLQQAIDRYETEQLTPEQRGGVETLRILVREFVNECFALMADIEPAIAQAEADLPLQWHVLLDDRATDADLGVAAEEYAAQVGLVTLLHRVATNSIARGSIWRSPRRRSLPRSKHERRDRASRSRRRTARGPSSTSS